MVQGSETIAAVNDLIGALTDGEQGYKQAAEAAKDPKLKSLFADYSAQRARFVTELRNAIRQLGESGLQTGTSIAGVIHRIWINMRLILTRGDERSILAECERGEDSAVKAYARVTKRKLSTVVREIVARQYPEIKSAHDRIHDLRDAARAS